MENGQKSGANSQEENLPVDMRILNQLVAMNSHILSIDKNMDQMNQNMNQMNQRMERVEGKIDKMFNEKNEIEEEPKISKEVNKIDESEKEAKIDKKDESKLSKEEVNVNENKISEDKSKIDSKINLIKYEEEPKEDAKRETYQKKDDIHFDIKIKKEYKTSLRYEEEDIKKINIDNTQQNDFKKENKNSFNSNIIHNISNSNDNSSKKSKEDCVNYQASSNSSKYSEKSAEVALGRKKKKLSTTNNKKNESFKSIKKKEGKINRVSSAKKRNAINYKIEDKKVKQKEKFTQKEKLKDIKKASFIHTVGKKEAQRKKKVPIFDKNKIEGHYTTDNSIKIDIPQISQFKNGQ